MADHRDQRGRRLAASGIRIERIGRQWLVPSQSKNGSRYTVDIEAQSCSCENFSKVGGICKHQHAVLYWIAWGYDVTPPANANANVTAAKPKRPTYKQSDWSAYHASQVEERDFVWRLGRALCDTLVEPPRTPGAGRPPIPIGDAVFLAILKTYAECSNARLGCLIADAAAKGHLRHAYHYNAISRLHTDAEMTPILVQSAEDAAVPLRAIGNGQYAVDSSGMSNVVHSRWLEHRHGEGQPHRRWTKLHICACTVTRGITAVAVYPDLRGDSPELIELVNRTRRRFDVREVSADTAYSANANYEQLEDWGIQPFIPFRVDAKMNEKAPVWSKYLGEFCFNQDKFAAHFRRRPAVEGVFSDMKRVLGESIPARSAVGQVNSVIVMCLVHNLRCLTRAIFMADLAASFGGCEPIVAPPRARKVGT